MPRRTGTPSTPVVRIARASLPGTRAWALCAARSIRIGTASWTDKTLLEPGLFYPKDAKTAADRLRYYTEQFPLVEVDATYYALPAVRSTQAWIERSPGGFVFNIKAFSMLTQHPTQVRALPKDLREQLSEEAAEKPHVYPRDIPKPVQQEIWQRFFVALAPLHAAGKLRAVLFQFPEWFPPSKANRAYILACRDRLAEALPGAAMAVEFRSEGWMRDAERQERTLSFLAEHALPYVCVDMPLGLRTSIPPVARATSDLAMVRFHGRNASGWGKRGVAVSERFRYDYTEQELSEWTSRIKDLSSQAREVHVLMNNCYRDYAVRSARTMAQLLIDAG